MPSVLAEFPKGIQEGSKLGFHREIHVGVQQGRPPDSVQPPAQDTRPTLGSEIGPTEDTFMVYTGGPDSAPLAHAPVWRYAAKNALHSPDVPAVTEFRKAIEAALKKQQKTTKP